MTLFACLCVLVVGIVTVKIARYLQKIWKLPPGPWGLPVFGLLLHLNKHNALTEFEKYKEQYGSIFSIKLGSFSTIVVNDHIQIRKMLNTPKFQDRPDFKKWTRRNFGQKNRGIFFQDETEDYTMQKKFVMSTLRSLGYNGFIMDELIVKEFCKLSEYLETQTEKPINFKNGFMLASFNPLLSLILGKQFELNDSVLKDLTGKLDEKVKALNVTCPLLFLPWLAPFYKQETKIFKDHEKLAREFIRNKVKNHRDGEKNLISEYLEWNRKRGICDEEARKNLYTILNDFYLASTETTSAILQWFLYYLAKYPQTQNELYKQIIHAVGTERLPAFTDRIDIPYAEAFLSEAQRHASPVPILYHKCSHTTIFNGHYIPKDTTLLLNLHSANFDATVWENPHEFKPERFLNEDFTKFMKNDAWLGFSAGKRSCTGEALARKALFIYLTGLVQKFELQLENNVEIDYAENPNMLRAPTEFKVILSKRRHISCGA